MADLLNEYFQRDLSDAELEALQVLLQGPEENAAKFSRNAASFYRGMRLREPGRIGGLNHWMLGSLVSAGFIGTWLAWQGLGRPPVPVPAPPAPIRLAGTAAQPETGPDAGVSVIERPIEPVPVSTETTFDSLAVQVELPDPRQVKVRVMDASGKEVRSLYQGLLAKGDWSFEWDGKVGARTASPGIYLIEVRAGTFSERRVVKIQVQ